ncbi:unnamed protein product [Caenorhabditis auriculariae]|uniref:Uncharacterized protein n=1 Tax=Caenorhabditis auriculariae TaxID=2777116 RepID=A0A8S1GV93_9PELO|nr:unnamed protein product [Caenorhabditis auriculariae]
MLKIFHLVLLFSFALAKEEKFGPNAFLSVKISKDAILQQVQQIQADLNFDGPEIRQLNHLHINDTNKQRTFDALSELPKQLCNVSHSIPILFMGTATRANTTLYGRLNAMSASVVSSIHHAINETFSKYGVDTILPFRIFEPHMSIVHLRHGENELYDVMSNKTFRLSTGEFVGEILLCRDSAPKNGSFYEILGRATLAPCSNFTLNKSHLETNRVPHSLLRRSP